MDIKSRVEDLAIFGGSPTFSEPRHVGSPNIGDRNSLFVRINDILDRRWLTNDGPFVRELEDKLARVLQVKHCVATCNATLALELTIRAVGLHGEVIVPSFTFIATVHALQLLGITPVFCDVGTTHNLDAARVEELITDRTTGIIGVHLWGRPCEVNVLADVAHRYGLRMIFDAAHALGCSAAGRPVGGFGDAETFSFHATKFINSFEGGLVATNDDDLATSLRRARNFGFTGYDRVDGVGTNAKMNEVSAAMALTSLEGMGEIVEVNRRHYEEYESRLGPIPGVRLIAFDAANTPNYQYVVLEIDESATGISRDQLMDVLWAENVLARRYFYPGCHRMEPYRSLYPDAGAALSVTEGLTQRVMQLPTGTAVTPDEVASICQLIRVAVSDPAVARRLARRTESRYR